MIHTMYYSKSMSPMDNAAVGDFVCGIIGADVSDFCSMGVYDNGKLIAGVLFHDYYPDYGVIEISGASINKRWMTKPVLRGIFFLAFSRLECQLVVMRVSEKNKAMIAIARKFGFSEFYIPRLRGKNEGEFIFTLSCDDWENHKVNKDG